MHRPPVCCGAADGLPGRCQKSPSPQPSPQGEGASNNASAASLLWRGLWPPWQVSEKPLPLSPSQGGEKYARERRHGATRTTVRGTPIHDRQGPLFITSVPANLGQKLLPNRETASVAHDAVS